MGMSEIWKSFIDEQMQQDYMKPLISFVTKRRSETSVYPPAKEVFNAFVQCSWYDLKVVIIGDEPYNTPLVADGLAFSTKQSQRPAQLAAIFKEIYADCFNNFTGGINVHQNNDLSQWAWQGVLLLNRVMTVDEGKKGSHAGKGWEQFTENTIKFISNNHNHRIVFIFWGYELKKLREFVNEEKHLVLFTEHAVGHEKWRQNSHFSRANTWIKKHYFNVKPPVNWATFNETHHILKPR